MSNYEKARQLASRLYSVSLSREIDQKTGDYIYLAETPEIVGCMAQGNTLQEAREALEAARIDMIEFLLDNQLSVPPPNSHLTQSGGFGTTFYLHWQIDKIAKA